MKFQICLVTSKVKKKLSKSAVLFDRNFKVFEVFATATRPQLCLSWPLYFSVIFPIFKERDETTLYHCSVSVRTSLTHSLNVPPNFLTAKNFKGRRFSLVASLSPWNWLFDFHYASVYVLCGMTQSLHSDGAVTHKKLDLEHRMLEKCKTVGLLFTSC